MMIGRIDPSQHMRRTVAGDNGAPPEVSQTEWGCSPSAKVCRSMSTDTSTPPTPCGVSVRSGAQVHEGVGGEVFGVAGQFGDHGGGVEVGVGTVEQGVDLAVEGGEQASTGLGVELAAQPVHAVAGDAAPQVGLASLVFEAPDAVIGGEEVGEVVHLAGERFW